MGWEQTRGFSLAEHCWWRAQRAELCMPWVCWMGVSTALCSTDSPFHPWDQRFSLCADHTTATFSTEIWIYLTIFKYLGLCLLPAQEHLWALGGWVLRKGVDFSPIWGGLLVCFFCLVQGKALRTVLWAQPPGSRLPGQMPSARDPLLPKQLWNHFPSCCDGGQCAAWNFSVLVTADISVVLLLFRFWGACISEEGLCMIPQFFSVAIT